MMLLKHLLCRKVDFPCKRTEGKIRPKMFRKECCLGECDQCIDFWQSPACILNCPTLFNDNNNYRWKEYKNNSLDNGKELKELCSVTGSLQAFRVKFDSLFVKYRKHYFVYKWLNMTRQCDLENLGQNELFIQTDYSAQPTLDSQDKLNCVGHGVCVLSCWVVLHSPREEFYMLDGERRYYTFYECDHIRVVSPSTGKQKDQGWFLHCKFFEYLINHYKQKLSHLHTVVIWTDGSPNQYKCRQNLYWLSIMFSVLGIIIIHRFAATAQFKGIHDKIGQVAKWVVQ